MGKHLCVGALVLVILTSLAVLPVAVIKLAYDIRTLVTRDFRAAAADSR
ncbi:MAG TPA: hypothetical protein VN282_09590 [Pyrinomonadaceae bacterium]|nr:hypothetical protein [Pyrinomonadaceae bacterium]